MIPSEWGGLDDGHPCVGNGVWCADRNLTRNLGMVVGMVGKNVGVQVRPDVV